MAIQPLPVISEEEEQKALDRLKPPETIVVRYGYMRQIGEFPYAGQEVPGCGTELVVRTPRGVELATMLTTVCTNAGCGHSITRDQMLQYIDNSGGKQFPFTKDGKVLRVATPEDRLEQKKLDATRNDCIASARRTIEELGLPMKIVEAEMLLGGDRIVFYFTSEGRVDFRELVRLLAGELHTRIEMRQVGARDEARLVADYEKCGQHCCCRQFLKVLKPVSMRNAKIQKATLDPSKISGRCGRLMCCLRYEEVTYDELRKRLPHRSTRMMTEDGPGKVVDTQILTQLVLIELESTGQRAAYPLEHVHKVTAEEEAELKEQAEAARQAAEERSRRRGKRGGERGGEPRRPKPGKPLTDAEVENREGQPPIDPAAAAAGQPDVADPAATPGATPGEDQGGEGPKRRRRRRGGRRRRRKAGGEDGQAGDGGQAPQARQGGASSGDEGGSSENASNDAGDSADAADGGGGARRRRRRRGSGGDRPDPAEGGGNDADNRPPQGPTPPSDGDNPDPPNPPNQP